MILIHIFFSDTKNSTPDSPIQDETTNVITTLNVILEKENLDALSTTQEDVSTSKMPTVNVYLESSTSVPKVATTTKTENVPRSSHQAEKQDIR